MSFSADLNKIANKFDGTIDEFIGGVEFKLFNAVIMRTPVDTGRLRGNWFISKNSPSSEQTENVDPNGNQSLRRVESFISALKGGRVTFLVNNLPYAQAIENGSSKQAPQGMVKVSVAQFQRLVAKEARRVR